MNILLFCLFLSALYSDEPKDLLAVDIRQRIMNDKQTRIVIQINNNSQRNISELDGFLLQINSKGDILSEKRITFLEHADGALQPKQSEQWPKCGRLSWLRALVFNERRRS